jgi:hypothetical protein
MPVIGDDTISQRTVAVPFLVDRFLARHDSSKFPVFAVNHLPSVRQDRLMESLKYFCHLHPNDDACSVSVQLSTSVSILM